MERRRIPHVLDAKGKGSSHPWMILTLSREIDGKEEWINRGNRYPICVLMPRSRQHWQMLRPISTFTTPQKEEKEVAKERKAHSFAITVKAKDIGLPNVP